MDWRREAHIPSRVLTFQVFPIAYQLPPVHACKLSTQEAEEEGSPWIPAQFGLYHSDRAFKNISQVPRRVFVHSYHSPVLMGMESMRTSAGTLLGELHAAHLNLYSGVAPRTHDTFPVSANANCYNKIAQARDLQTLGTDFLRKVKDPGSLMITRWWPALQTMLLAVPFRAKGLQSILEPPCKEANLFKKGAFPKSPVSSYHHTEDCPSTYGFGWDTDIQIIAGECKSLRGPRWPCYGLSGYSVQKHFSSFLGCKVPVSRDYRQSVLWTLLPTSTQSRTYSKYPYLSSAMGTLVGSLVITCVPVLPLWPQVMTFPPSVSGII